MPDVQVASYLLLFTCALIARKTITTKIVSTCE